MERIEVVFCAATNLRTTALAGWAETQPGNSNALVERLCDLLQLKWMDHPSGNIMLGGAYASLRLWIPDKPEYGGTIWLRPGLPPEKRAFALAHELGHYILHRGEGLTFHPICDEAQVDEQANASALRVEDHRVEEYTPRARRELEANAFAAELLAPHAEVRRLFATQPYAGPTWLAAHFGISPTLAQQRLIDAIFSAGKPSNAPASASTSEATPAAPTTRSDPAEFITQLDSSQREAACASSPALVIAGPGTGKTATLVGRVAHLIVHRHLQPEHILALTFSNRAAGEMRERLVRHNLPGERIPVMTIHAFAASLLREYASQVPCAPDEPPLSPDFRILDQPDAFLLLEELLGELPLHYYRSLGNPTGCIPTLLEDFSHARDQLLTPEAYLALVAAMPRMPDPPAEAADPAGNRKRTKASQPELPPGTFTPEQIARARERALAYQVWDRVLRQRGLVDFGGLIQRAVELLRARPKVLAEVRKRYQRVLVDEFQDTNRAAAEFLLLAAGDPAQELWVVGDQNQSIYRWRGASPLTNLTRLIEHFPSLRVYTLRRCYRSVPTIVQLGSAMAARMAELAPGKPHAQNTGASPASATLQAVLQPVPLEPDRQEQNQPAIYLSEFLNPPHEQLGLAAAIRRHTAQGYRYSDQAILCRTHKQAYRLASALAAEGLPVRQMGDFFERPEIKDTLALIALAVGPDVRGLLRAGALIQGMGYPAPSNVELAALIRHLVTNRQTLPDVLTDQEELASIAALTPNTRQALLALGKMAQRLRPNPSATPAADCSLSHDLATFLLSPRGYAWQLLRIADGFDPPPHSQGTPAPGNRLLAAESQPHAQAALAALGELIHLAARFEHRWNREPGFRARLSRAVAHWYSPANSTNLSSSSAAPAQQDSAAQPLVTTPSDTPAGDTAAALTAPTPDAPAACCFLHYLDALRAADALITVPAAEENAIHILTLHASKGLEFPIVYLPGLVQGHFPGTPNRREEACPPGFREYDAPGEREAEERCLFYVGVTRARDVIVLTRAATDGKKHKQPSPLLFELIEGALPDEQMHPLLPEEEHTALAARAMLMDESAEESDDADDDGPKQPIAHPEPGQESRPTFPLHALEQYLKCPLRYKYAHSYALVDPAQNAVYRFYRYIRWGLSTLRQMYAIMPQADWTIVERQLQTLWEKEGPVGHAYDAFYWQRAQAVLRHEWKKLTSDPAAHTGKVSLHQHLDVALTQCVVRVTADRITTFTADDTTSQTVLSRLHTGRQRKSDKDDLRLPLYYLGHQQRYPNTPVRIEIAYLGDVLADVALETGLPPQSDVIDMTDEARKTAETYLKPGRKAPSRLDKLDRAAAAIKARQFAPRPNQERCATCPYFYICPADPEA